MPNIFRSTSRAAPSPSRSLTISHPFSREVRQLESRPSAPHAATLLTATLRRAATTTHPRFPHLTLSSLYTEYTALEATYTQLRHRAHIFRERVINLQQTCRPIDILLMEPELEEECRECERGLEVAMNEETRLARRATLLRLEGLGLGLWGELVGRGVEMGEVREVVRRKVGICRGIMERLGRERLGEAARPGWIERESF